jgi:hypothetical protein
MRTIKHGFQPFPPLILNTKRVLNIGFYIRAIPTDPGKGIHSEVVTITFHLHDSFHIEIVLFKY